MSVVTYCPKGHCDRVRAARDFYMMLFIHSAFLHDVIHTQCLFTWCYSYTVPFYMMLFIHSAFLHDVIHTQCLFTWCYSYTVPFYMMLFIHSAFLHDVIHTQRLFTWCYSYTAPFYMMLFIHSAFLHDVIHTQRLFTWCYSYTAAERGQPLETELYECLRKQYIRMAIHRAPIVFVQPTEEIKCRPADNEMHIHSTTRK